MAEKSHIYINFLTLKDYKSYKGENTFMFTQCQRGKKDKFKIPQCTIFLGDNGTGKTNLLKVIANMIPLRVNVSDYERKSENDIPDLHIELNTSDAPKRPIDVLYRPNVIERYNKGHYNNTIQFAISHSGNLRLQSDKFSPYQRIINKIPRQDGSVIVMSEEPYIGYTESTNQVASNATEFDDFVLFGYGVNRFADTARNLKTDKPVDTLFFNDKPLINLEEWLMQLELAKKSDKKSIAQKRINLIKDILRKSDLFPDIDDYVIEQDENLNTQVLFKTPNGNYPLHELGYGYQCMFAWVFDFIKKMFDRYPNSDNPLKESAVLLLDEIDLHLHPQWQRHVLKDLCDLFPNTQIIATTHSPLVIQSADNMNLFMLTLVGGETKVKKYESTTFQGWSISEILDELMELGPGGERSEEYNNLRRQLDHEMNAGHVQKSIELYTKVKAMLHPNSTEREILDMDIEDLKARNND